MGDSALAILSIGEHWNERTASADRDGVREYVKSFRVIVDSAEDDPKTILAHSGLPQKYITTYSTSTDADPGARVVEVECRQEGEGYWQWMVVARYSSNWRTIGSLDPNPLLRPPVKQWGSVRGEDFFEEDLDEEAVVNSSWEPFDPPVSRRMSNRTLRITMFKEVFDPHFYDEYENTINEGSFFGYDPGHVYCASITGQDHFEGEYAVAQVVFEFEMSKTSWEHISVLDQGYMEVDAFETLDTGFYVTRPILVNGQPPTRPKLLDGDGNLLDLDNNDPVFLPFRAYAKKDFANLGIPT